MSPLRIIAIPTQVAETVRATHKAPRYNHPAHTEVAKGYGPCRHCLHTFNIGSENRILFTYDPFDGLEELPLPGPVFIHEASCERYNETAGFPDDLRSYPAVLNVYAKGLKLVEQVYVEPGEAENRLLALLQNLAVDYIEVRDRKAGCFDFRVERAFVTDQLTEEGLDNFKC